MIRWWRAGRMGSAGLMTCAVLVLVRPAWAAVLSVDGRVTSEVQEVVGGEVINSDTAFEDRDETTPNFPLVADSRLIRAGADTTASVTAAATATLRDPRLQVDFPPNEFSLDLVGLTDALDTVVTGQCEALETRGLSFGAQELGLTAGTAIVARSHFFVDAVLVLVSTEGSRSLAGASVELSIQVEQERPGSDSAETVLETQVTLTGNQDGTAVLSAQGALVPENLTTFGVTNSDPSVGALQVAVLPALNIAYDYPALVGEEFVLRARMKARSRSSPGTGSAVLVGTSVNTLVQLLDELAGGGTGQQFEDDFNASFASAGPPAKPLPTTIAPMFEVVEDVGQAVPTAATFCGTLGIESALLLTVFAALTVVGRRRTA